MPTPEWVEPRTDYDATSPVTPEIFNNIGSDLKSLNELKCGVEKQTGTEMFLVVTGIVLVEE